MLASETMRVFFVLGVKGANEVVTDCNRLQGYKA